MNAYDSLLKHGKAQLNVNQNGEELVCFYPHMLKNALFSQVDYIAQLKKQKEHWGNQYILENEKWKAAEKHVSDLLMKMTNNTKG